MLKVRNLYASVGAKEILKGVNLTIPDGEIHALMGPNGSGKSTLSHVLVGNPLYTVTSGEVVFNNKNLLEMKPENRSHEGLFMSFQQPVEIPGVSMSNFLRAALDAKRKYWGQEPLTTSEFLKLMKEKRQLVELNPSLTRRSVNEGFSGGENSGLDVDALRIVADGFKTLRTKNMSAIVITHYQKMLEYLRPDVVHVMLDGKIVCMGGPSLADRIEKNGFDWIREHVG